MTASSSTSPVQLQLPQERELNRWWGLLWFGMFVRYILAIPHLIILFVLVVAWYISMLILWIPILITGRVPGIWNTIGSELIKRAARVSSYILLFPGGYPALGMGQPGPVDLQVNLGDSSMNRLWGIPFFGLMARVIVLIPQLIVMYVIGIVAGVVGFFVWIPILLNGRYPDIAMKIIGLFIRYESRVLAYMLFLPVPYPPFDFSM